MLMACEEDYRWAPRIYWATSSLPLIVNVYTGDEPTLVLGTFDAIETGFTVWDAETETSLLYGSINEETNSGPGVALDGKNTVQWGQKLIVLVE